MPAPLDGDEFPTAESLAPLLRPRGIAVVGASANPSRFSGRILPALLAQGYKGPVHPVNPRHAELHGRRCYPSVSAVPDPCDLAIVAVPAAHVVDVVREAAERGVGAAVILTAGFDEVGGAGAQRAADLRALVPRIRIYGPNCPGLWQVRSGLVYTFSAQFDPAGLRPGPVGLVTQGGALGRAVVDAMEHGLGLHSWFSTGNEADLEAADFVALLADDPDAAVVAVLAEGWRDGRRFLRAVARCRDAGKPVVVAKLGTSTEGARAARGHTAAPAGSAAVAEAALRQAGCLTVQGVGELIDLCGLLARHPNPAPGGLGVCTFSGGAGVLLADAAAAAGIPLPDLHPDTERALRGLLPDIASVGNPTDLTTAVLEDPDLALQALRTMAADPGLAICLFPFPHRLDAFDAEMARRLAGLAAAGGKPVAAVALSPTFEREEAAATLRQAGVPVFGSARRAAVAVAGWLRRRQAEARVPYAAPNGHAPREALRDAGLRGAAVWDPVFGPAVACGPAGVWGRAHPDADVYRLAPLDLEEARDMLRQLGIWTLVAPETAEAAASALVRVGVESARRASAGAPARVVPSARRMR